MTNENVFTNKAIDYMGGRPSYAPEAIEYILLNMVQEAESVADVGSGTGILAKEFFTRGINTYCVEPNDDMRTEAERLYGENTYFHSIAASAEKTGIGEHSVSLITAASAFHWFDMQDFREECKRILKPNGIVCILGNARVHDIFTEQQREITQRYCPKFKSFTHGIDKTLENAEVFFGESYKMERYSFPLVYTKERFIKRSKSSSYAPVRGTPKYEEYGKALKDLLDRYFNEDAFTIANETIMLWGKVK